MTESLAAFIDRAQRRFAEDSFYRRDLLSEGSLSLEIRRIGDRSVHYAAA